MLQGRTVFSNNNASYGGAIQAFEANINVTGSVDFTKNLATVNGGALALDGYSVVYIFETVLLTFVENRARFSIGSPHGCTLPPTPLATQDPVAVYHKWMANPRMHI